MPPESANDPRTGEGWQGDESAKAKADRTEKPATTQSGVTAAKAQPVTVDALSALASRPEHVIEPSIAIEENKLPGEVSKPPGKTVDSHLKQVSEGGQLGEDRSALHTSSSPHVDEFVATAPHMAPPPFVHQFDTYGLVRRLEDSGWSKLHAITTMKAVRLMLAENTEFARDALVSKSQVENETYLFRAACAELKTEVTSRRRSEQERMRAQRSQLQHEVDILTQRLGQESASLKDEVKGMFDDRKMTVRNEQREMESKVQQLNYKITVDLQADARSEVEGLRWVMTRRVIIALGAVVIMVLGSLKLYSSAVHDQEMEAKRKASMKSNGSQTVGPGFVEGTLRDYRSSGGDGEVMVKEGDNPAFVSLG
jgi:hypothetical protein